jgi:hypothetical protein
VHIIPIVFFLAKLYLLTKISRNNKEILWSLTNGVAINVANGTCLIIVEVRGFSGKIYKCLAKLRV